MLIASMCGPWTSSQAKSASPCAVADDGSTSTHVLRVDGVTRDFLMHAPTNGSRQRLPLVFAFHGRGETPEGLEAYSGLSSVHAIVVYPRGLPGRGGKLSWSGTPTAAPGVDDVRFARAIFAQLKGSACVDETRVYATGKSDGAGLAAQLACSAADIVSAVAPVAGAYYPIAGGCTPVRPVAILEFHGDDDRVIPYQGSRKRNLPSVHTWLAAWADRDGCKRVGPIKLVLPEIVRQTWDACSAGVTVDSYRIAGGGHTWPGSRSASGPGSTTHAIAATAIIAEFFEIPE